MEAILPDSWCDSSSSLLVALGPHLVVLSLAAYTAMLSQETVKFLYCHSDDMFETLARENPTVLTFKEFASFGLLVRPLFFVRALVVVVRFIICISPCSLESARTNW